jgi:UDP-N-acetylmuramyl pentapeptide phosphotransferase/UDP-N-acetylglucosamine-1-phosphate transferase
MWNTFAGLPATKSGKWSVVFTIAFAVLFLVNTLVIIPASSDVSWEQIMLSFDGLTMVLCGLAAGITGLVALIYHHERSWLVWISIWPGLIVGFLLVSEFLFPD